MFCYLSCLENVIGYRILASSVKNSGGRKVKLVFDFFHFSSNNSIFMNFRSPYFIILLSIIIGLFYLPNRSDILLPFETNGSG